MNYQLLKEGDVSQGHKLKFALSGVIETTDLQSLGKRVDEELTGLQSDVTGIYFDLSHAEEFSIKPRRFFGLLAYITEFLQNADIYIDVIVILREKHRFIEMGDEYRQLQPALNYPNFQLVYGNGARTDSNNILLQKEMIDQLESELVNLKIKIKELTDNTSNLTLKLGVARGKTFQAGPQQGLAVAYFMVLLGLFSILCEILGFNLIHRGFASLMLLVGVCFVYISVKFKMGIEKVVNTKIEKRKRDNGESYD